MTFTRKPKTGLTDAQFEQKQLAECDRNTMPPQDEPILQALALAPVAAKHLEVMPKQESTQMVVLKPDEMKALLADFPDSDFQRGAGGNQDLLYLEHAALRNRLSNVVGLGQWRFEVVKSWSEEFKSGNPPKDAVRIYIEGRLIIRGVQADCSIGDGVYYKANASSSYSDGYESSKTAAFRRCCKNFGIGLQAFSKDWCDEWKAKYKNFTRPQRKA